MRSPFPGMDPYIESCNLWEDFHQKLIGEIEGRLAQSVPDQYVVRLGERSYVVLTTSEEAGRIEFRTQADVAITSAPGPAVQTAMESSSATAVAEEDTEESPVRMRALIEVEFRESFIEIKDSRRGKLVTTIEVLSPSNKRYGTLGWQQFRRKRQAHLEGKIANLVEIDLLRGGERMPMEDEWPASPYYVLVSRIEEGSECAVWRAHSIRPVPEIPVPLAHPDPDVPLSLQPLIDAIYRRSRYELDIDYREPSVPPLSQGEADWLAERLDELGTGA